jgi:hypothetical protein
MQSLANRVGPQRCIEVTLRRPGDQPLVGGTDQATLEPTQVGQELGEDAAPLIPQFDRSRHGGCRYLSNYTIVTVHMNGVHMNGYEQKNSNFDSRFPAANLCRDV